MEEYIIWFETLIDDISNDLRAYKQNKSIWEKLPGTSNSGGNLILHLTGNLNHFIGRALGNTTYERNREEEFSKSNINRSELLNEIKKAKVMVRQVLGGMSKEMLDGAYPAGYWVGEQMNIRFSLLKLLAHFARHAGQLNYHRRIANARSAYLAD